VIASSLRLRLILAFSALVSLVLFVGIASYSINEQVRTSVSDLQPSDRVDISGIDWKRLGVEFEGYWNSPGAFIATQVSEVPELKYPKLRGRIQSVAPDVKSFTMYGLSIRLTPGTDGDPDRSGKDVPLDPKKLAAGLRAEVSCKVDDVTHEWTATKVELENVKSSDKVKGMITADYSDGQAPETVEIHGLQIVLQPVEESGPETAFGRIEHGTRMLRALQKFRAAAHTAVGPHSDASDKSWLNQSAALEMDREAAMFEQVLADADSGGKNPMVVPMGDSLRHLQQLGERVPRLQELVRDMHRRFDAGNQSEALDFLSGTVEPFLDGELLQFVYAYLHQAEEDLGDELHRVLDRTGETTRIALGTSLIAVLVAVVLGLMVWRSIHRPIRRLHDAAMALGQGRLETRVDVSSHDEFGVLARAFNSMAGQLAASTVSVAGLQSMFDSMAASVILCDQNGAITRTNAAADRLLGAARGSTSTRPVRAFCKLTEGETLSSLASASARVGGSLDRAMLRTDGTEVPVSLSCSALRTSDGALQGYVLVAQDLTQLKAVEEQLRESLGEKELLLREVHHRVKNNMQVISSLLAMQSTSGDPEVLRKLEDSQHRIRTIALIHEQLYQQTELARIDTQSYLKVLAQHLVQSYGKAEQVNLDLDVDNLNLDLDQSLACGLIVNELLTNAFKYAFEDGRAGRVSLRLKELPDGMRLLEVADDGLGFQPKTGEKRRTLGTSLVAKLARQLRGKVTTTGDGGVTVRILFEGQQKAATVNA
jgi:PAS domain S-box-containing protein